MTGPGGRPCLCTLVPGKPRGRPRGRPGARGKGWCWPRRCHVVGENVQPPELIKKSRTRLRGILVTGEEQTASSHRADASGAWNEVRGVMCCLFSFCVCDSLVGTSHRPSLGSTDSSHGDARCVGCSRCGLRSCAPTLGKGAVTTDCCLAQMLQGQRVGGWPICSCSVDGNSQFCKQRCLLFLPSACWEKHASVAHCVQQTWPRRPGPWEPALCWAVSVVTWRRPWVAFAAGRGLPTRSA